MENGSLMAGLKHQPELPLFKIPYPTMNHSGGPAAGAAGKIPLIKEDCRKASECRIPGYTRPYDPPANHNEVVFFFFKFS
jgi:hypothetical protein